MFYAFDNKYGINTRSADSNDRIGKVRAFMSKNDRDDYVYGNSNAEPIDSKEARRYLIAEIKSYMEPMTDAEREDIAHAPMAELVSRVESINDTYGF